MLLKDQGDVVEVIVEALSNSIRDHFINCCQNNNPTLFCAPIGHRQERDYQESWQPATILDKDLYEAKDMAEKLPKP
jgi:phosphoribosylglycinamide formyltransferase 2